MTPDQQHRPLAGSGSGDPAGGSPGPRPGLSCWLCGHAVIDPPRIIGQHRAGQVRVAHRYCLRVLGELDLNLPFPSRP